MAEPTRRDLAASRRGRAATAPIRHGQLRAHRAWPSVLRFVASAVVVVLVAAVSISAYIANNLHTKLVNNSFDIAQPGETPPPIQVGEFKGGFNLLIVGADNDPKQGDAYGVRGGTLNDVNILLHVSADHTSATVVSLPRDLVIAHPTCADPTTGVVYGAMSAQPLNVAMSRGGVSCVVKTVEKLTGLSIPYAAQLSFKGVVEMTDAIGGVKVCLANDINDPKADLDLKAGIRTLKGKTALGFLRTRHGVGDGSDLSRISVQQIYLSALVRQIKSSDTLENPVRLYNLADAAASYVHLSKSLTSLDTMVAMAKTLRTVDLATLSFVQYPGSTGNKLYPGKVVPNVALATRLFDLIKADKPVKASTLGRASEVDTASTNSPTDAATGTATPTDSPTPAQTATTLDGLQGQTGDTVTCARGFLK